MGGQHSQSTPPSGKDAGYVVIQISIMVTMLIGLTVKQRTIVSGLEATPVMRVTVCQLTMDTSSQQLIETMTTLPSAVPVPQLMAEDGGSTGPIRKCIELC